MEAFRKARRCENEEGFKPYAEANGAIFKKFKGRFVVLGDKFELRTDIAGRVMS